MINKNTILKLVEEKLEGTNIFPVDIKVTPQNKIFIFIDADTHVTIDDCIALSKHIEGNLDRDKEDFELNVSSAGLDQSLKLARQYTKNIGRQVNILIKTGEKYTGKLSSFEADVVTLELATNKKKKKKEADNEEETIKTISLNDIKETKIILTL